jgi:CubicO group peptidase (beta-lactamase class C family)
MVFSKATAASLLLLLPELVAGQSYDDPRTAAIDRLMRAYAELEQFSGAALIAEDGEVLYRAAWGMADRELGVKASPDHRFVIGSNTKAFTAVLVLQQVNEGRLGLDEPAVRYWPEFPDPSGGRITVRHLLAHRSGLGHWGAVEGFLSREARLKYAKEDVIKLYAQQGLKFEPGEDEAYSSIGYYVLGVLLEKITGVTYGELLRERIFEPLGMSSSSLDDHATILPGRASPYRYNFLEARYDNADYRDPSTTFSTGGIISTVDDLLRWNQALYGDRLLPAALRDLLFDASQGSRAFGWNKRALPTEEQAIYWHAGLVTGFRSQLTRLPDTRRTVILLGNLRDIDTSEITRAILDVLDGGEVAMPKRSLMKEVLSQVAASGVDAAIARFDEIVGRHTDEFRTHPTELLLAAIELRSDDACDRAAPLYEHWIRSYEGSRYVQLALRDAADCRLRLGELEAARLHIDRLAAENPAHPSLDDLRARLSSGSS